LTDGIDDRWCAHCVVISAGLRLKPKAQGA
jgi:hypothetical protein